MIVYLEVSSSLLHSHFTANPLQVSLIQAWYYYTHQNDKWPFKTLVSPHSYSLHSPTWAWSFRSLLLWFATSFIKPWLRIQVRYRLRSLHLGLTRRAVYTYLITYFAEPAQLENIVWYVFLLPGIWACLTASCYRSLVVSEGYLAYMHLIVTHCRSKFCST